MKQAHHIPLSAEAAFTKVAALCARSEQAPGDIRTKVLGWGVEPDEADGIIRRLKAERYLDEERYARAFCHDKVQFNGWGRIKIAFMLKTKGIGATHIDNALAEINEEEYSKMLEKLLKQKLADVRKKDYQQAKASMVRYAASRGFEPDKFYPIIDRLMSATGFSEEE